jgi:glycosyltransferase involved in cell wall biosynthesis
MRIFMLVQHPNARGPVPKHTSHLVTALRSLDCTVVTHPWGQERAGESLLEKLIQRPRDVISVYRTLRHSTFDVAIVKTSHDWRTLLRDIAVALVIRRRCRPIVLQFHGSLASRLVERGGHAFKLTTAALLALVDGVMVLSTEEQRQWRALRPRPHVFVVKNPYVSIFPTLQEPTNDAARGRVLFVGRLIKAKGIFDLIDALPAVLERTQCGLVVVGDGDQEQELRIRIHRLGLDDHVTLAGYLTGSELTDRYREATIFVLPTSWNEGFPTVLAEAMDAGLPIVTTRIRGAADHLEPGENALFVEAGDAKGLASAITTLLADRDLRSRMATANRERMRMFEPQVVAAEYLDVLRSVARGMSGGDQEVRGNEVGAN